MPDRALEGESREGSEEGQQPLDLLHPSPGRLHPVGEEVRPKLSIVVWTEMSYAIWG